MTTPLEQLADASGVDFPNLRKARERTKDGLASRRETLGNLESDDDVAIVLMGSWGRAEVTGGSDDDFMFAGGLLPVLECESRTKDEMAGFLATQFRMPPVDRIAMSFLKHGAIDPLGPAV